MLKIENLKFKYNNKIVFDKFTYHFKSDKIYHINGSIGSGKTTLLNIISGMNRYEGEIICDFDFLREIYYSPTKPFNIPWLTMENNIKEFICNKDYEILKDMIGEFDVQKYANQYPIDFDNNVGIIKKFDFIKMFILNKKITLIDDPFLFLDDISINKIKKHINIHQTKNKTLILISGNDSRIKNICNEVILL